MLGMGRAERVTGEFAIVVGLISKEFQCVDYEQRYSGMATWPPR